MENTQEGLNFLTLIFKGGVVMIPIGMLSVVTIYLIIERFIYIKNVLFLNFFSTQIKSKGYFDHENKE